MSGSVRDGVAVIKPDQTYVGKQGFTYRAGASAETVGAQNVPVNDGKQTMKGVTPPIYQWTPVIAPSGMIFYSGDAFPDWKNNLFVGGLAAASLVRLELEATGSCTRSVSSRGRAPYRRRCAGARWYDLCDH
jgi:hypothetical protein